MWNSSVDLLNMEAHHVPSLNQSLLWGFSPVGATTELALYEKSRYPMSLAADDVPAYPKRSTRTVNSGRAIRLMVSCLVFPQCRLPTAVGFWPLCYWTVVPPASARWPFSAFAGSLFHRPPEKGIPP